jgi:thiosulfate/3-mercaptopyruvate sulfurtransferase
VTRYVILGAGAVGVTFAAELQRSGAAVTLVARGAQLDALRAGQLRYFRPDGERRLTIPAAGGPAEVTLRPDDVLVLATKSQDAGTVIAHWAWQPVRDDEGGTSWAADSLPLLTLQNGLETERIAQRRFATVLGGVLWLPSSYVAPGEVASPGAPAPGVVWVGACPAGIHPRLPGIVDDLRVADFEAQVVPDIARWKAAKLLSSVTFALAALYPASELRDQAGALLAGEAREILTAAGQSIADVRAESTVDLNRFASHPIPARERGGNSTWQSLARSGSVESDYLNGEIVLQARLLGGTAPANQAVLTRLHQAAGDGIAPGSLGHDDLLAVLPQLRTGPPVLIDAP